MSQQAMEAVNVEPVKATGECFWTIELFEENGKCHVRVNTNAGWRPKQAKLTFYEGAPPANHRDSEKKAKKDSWWYPGAGVWNTGLPWGSNWSAALIAKDDDSSKGGDYFYVVKTGTTH